MLNDIKKNSKNLILASGLIDSHFHILSMRTHLIDPKQALQAFFANGGTIALDIGVNLAQWEERLSYHQDFPRVFFAAGVHPNEANDPLALQPEVLEKQLEHPFCCALGEIGLDFYRGKDLSLKQEELFLRQLEIARVKKLPIIIHNRCADKEIIRILKKTSWEGAGIIHCFSSTRAFASQFLDLGFILSFAGNVTYRQSDELREVARYVPSDKYLIETDAPYLTPIPVRGQPNQPLFAAYTAACLASIKGIDTDMLVHQVSATFSKLFPALTFSEFLKSK